MSMFELYDSSQGSYHQISSRNSGRGTRTQAWMRETWQRGDTARTAYDCPHTRFGLGAKPALWTWKSLQTSGQARCRRIASKMLSQAPLRILSNTSEFHSLQYTHLIGIPRGIRLEVRLETHAKIKTSNIHRDVRLEPTGEVRTVISVFVDALP